MAIDLLPVDPRFILADPMRADEHEAARAAIRQEQQEAAAAAAAARQAPMRIVTPPEDTVVSEFFGMTIRESEFDDSGGTEAASEAPVDQDDADSDAPAAAQTYTAAPPAR